MSVHSRRTFLMSLLAPFGLSAQKLFTRMKLPAKRHRPTMFFVYGADQHGSKLVIAGPPGFQLGPSMRNDWFAIRGVHTVNPHYYQQNPKPIAQLLRYFMVTENAEIDETGLVELKVWPPIIPLGQYQNVDNVPADGAEVLMPGFAGVTAPITE